MSKAFSPSRGLLLIKARPSRCIYYNVICCAGSTNQRMPRKKCRTPIGSHVTPAIIRRSDLPCSGDRRSGRYGRAFGRVRPSRNRFSHIHTYAKRKHKVCFVAIDNNLTYRGNIYYCSQINYDSNISITNSLLGVSSPTTWSYYTTFV